MTTSNPPSFLSPLTQQGLQGRWRRVTAPRPPHSYVLVLNALLQPTHAPFFAVDPHALLAPFECRLARLDVGPTMALARGVQVLLLCVAGSVGIGKEVGGHMMRKSRDK
ncbi:hypothetical protein BJV78DRAFT_1235886 [Lactifluus subvellereus]|nr:hypothetical protein BJV78DRAFT_1235886 [Lactifluus subvellereus]